MSAAVTTHGERLVAALSEAGFPPDSFNEDGIGRVAWYFQHPPVEVFSKALEICRSPHVLDAESYTSRLHAPLTVDLDEFDDEAHAEACRLQGFKSLRASL